MGKRSSAFKEHVLRYLPPGANDYYLVRDQERGLPIRNPASGAYRAAPSFQHPTGRLRGRAAPCDTPTRPVLVGLREPVAKRRADAQVVARSDSRADLLSLLDRHYELNCELRSTLRTLADQWSRIEGHYQRAAIAPDYTAVLKYLADSFREALRPPMGTVPVAQPVKSNDCAGKPAAGSVSAAAAVAAVEAATLQAIAAVTKSAAQPKPSSLEDATAKADAQLAALAGPERTMLVNRAHLIELERKPT